MVSAMSCLAVHNELRHGVTVHIHPHVARDLLLLHQWEEQGDKLLAVWRSNGLKQLFHKIPEIR